MRKPRHLVLRPALRWEGGASHESPASTANRSSAPVRLGIAMSQKIPSFPKRHTSSEGDREGTAAAFVVRIMQFGLRPVAIGPTTELARRQRDDDGA